MSNMPGEDNFREKGGRSLHCHKTITLIWFLGMTSKLSVGFFDERLLINLTN